MQLLLFVIRTACGRAWKKCARRSVTNTSHLQLLYFVIGTACGGAFVAVV
jgi:hypothetical protein